MESETNVNELYRLSSRMELHDYILSSEVKLSGTMCHGKGQMVHTASCTPPGEDLLLDKGCTSVRHDQSTRKRCVGETQFYNVSSGLDRESPLSSPSVFHNVVAFCTRNFTLRWNDGP